MVLTFFILKVIILLIIINNNYFFILYTRMVRALVESIIFFVFRLDRQISFYRYYEDLQWIFENC